MDFFYITFPSTHAPVFIPALILLGFSVGMISAFLGIGGAWLVTPALNILGFPMTYAIGTDIAHMGGKGFLATCYHAKKSNVDYLIALFMSIGTVVGIEAGAQTIMFLEKFQKVEPLLRWTYIFLLSLIILMIFLKRKEQTIDWPQKISPFFPGPILYFKTSKIHCSIWIPISIGLTTGYVAGFLGVGGGLLRLPLLIYCMGCPVLVAIGTDLFEVMLSGFYGGFSYAMKGRVDYLAALFMLMGALLGTKIGVATAYRVQDQKIKNQFGCAVFGCLISIIFKQMNYPILSRIALFTTLLFLVGSIFVMFYRNVLNESKD